MASSFLRKLLGACWFVMTVLMASCSVPLPNSIAGGITVANHQSSLPDPGAQFTDQAKHALGLALREAGISQSERVGVEHVLLGLLGINEGGARPVLESLGVSIDDLISETKAAVAVGHGSPPDLPLTPEVKEAFEASIREAQLLHSTHLGTEHILLGLLGGTNGVSTILERRGVNLALARAEVIRQAGH